MSSRACSFAVQAQLSCTAGSSVPEWHDRQYRRLAGSDRRAVELPNRRHRVPPRLAHVTPPVHPRVTSPHLVPPQQTIAMSSIGIWVTYVVRQLCDGHSLPFDVCASSIVFRPVQIGRSGVGPSMRRQELRTRNAAELNVPGPPHERSRPLCLERDRAHGSHDANRSTRSRVGRAHEVRELRSASKNVRTRDFIVAAKRLPSPIGGSDSTRRRSSRVVAGLVAFIRDDVAHSMGGRSM